MSSGSDSPRRTMEQMGMDRDLRNIGPRVAYRSENCCQKHMFNLISTGINVALFITVIVLVFTSNKGSPHDVNTILTTPETPTTTTTSRPKGVCLPGYDVWKDNCYKVYTIPTTFDVAEKTCVGDGTHLVSIHSYEENEYVNYYYRTILDGSGHQVADESFLGYLSFWIGLAYDFPLGAYKWTDGTMYDYSFWRPNGNRVRDGYYWAVMNSYFVNNVSNMTQWDHNLANNSDRHTFVCKHPL